MYKEKSILGVIPARGGSRGLPGKNILNLHGKPLIAWTIEAALASRYLDRVIVSTEDRDIIAAARRSGAGLPFIRPIELATDSVGATDVAIHALEWFEKQGTPYDIVVLLQPTSPMRSTQDIETAVQLLFSKDARAVVSVSEMEHHPYKSNVLPGDDNMKDFFNPAFINKVRQELPVFFRTNGAIYVSYTQDLKARKSFFGEKTYAYRMPPERSVDIDNELDFKFAEFLFERGTK